MASDDRHRQPGFDHAAGWTTLTDLVTASEARQMNAVCESLLGLPGEQRCPRDKVAGGTFHLHALADRSDLINTVVSRPRLIDVVTTILGPDFDQDEIAYRNPQPTFGGQMLHADDHPRLHAGPATVAAAIIALTDFTPTNGATRIIPGSHDRPDLQRQSGSLEDHPDQIFLTGPAGTAFVFSGHVMHSGTTNTSDRPRPALHLVWRLSPS